MSGPFIENEPGASPDPSVPQTADKARVGAIVAAILVAVFLFLAFYFDGRNGTNWTELLLSLLGSAGVAVPVGWSVFNTKNRLKKVNPNRKPRRNRRSKKAHPNEF